MRSFLLVLLSILRGIPALVAAAIRLAIGLVGIAIALCWVDIYCADRLLPPQETVLAQVIDAAEKLGMSPWNGVAFYFLPFVLGMGICLVAAEGMERTR